MTKTNCKYHGIRDQHPQGGCLQCWIEIENQFNDLADGLDKDSYVFTPELRVAMSRIVAAVARQDIRKGRYRSCI